MAITRELLEAAEPANDDAYYASIVGPMSAYAAVYDITTPLRIAHFLAQIGHESHFKVVEEKGRYSARRMREVFGCKGGMKNYNAVSDDCRLGRLRGKLWSEEQTYANDAENLLSYVYASRNGNGDEASGDGYRYRGRGMVQLTFRGNYDAFTKAHNARNPDDPRDFVAEPDLLVSEPKYGIESAFFFWDARKLNPVADTDDVEAVTRAVNGGLNGLPDRQARLRKVKAVLGIT